jgi:hypothetical protein
MHIVGAALAPDIASPFAPVRRQFETMRSHFETRAA